MICDIKLHAVSSATRSKPEQDWEDIRQILQICGLNANESEFRALIVRYRGEKGAGKDRIISKMSDKRFVFEPFDLPVFDEPQKEHWLAAISWDAAMQQFGALHKEFRAQLDSAEARLRANNSEPFHMD